MSPFARLLEAASIHELRDVRVRLHREVVRAPQASNRLLEAACVAISDELLARGQPVPDCPFCRASVTA